MSDRDHDEDLWQEFDRLPPAGPDRVQEVPGGQPQGFGFRTGVRSARVALGFAVYALALGTVLVVTGAVVFMSQGRWLMLGLTVLIETVFVFAFSRLARQARNRRSAQKPRLQGTTAGSTAVVPCLVLWVTGRTPGSYRPLTQAVPATDFLA